jgi:hypothetical protein
VHPAQAPQGARLSPEGSNSMTTPKIVVMKNRMYRVTHYPEHKHTSVEVFVAETSVATRNGWKDRHAHWRFIPRYGRSSELWTQVISASRATE